MTRLRTYPLLIVMVSINLAFAQDQAKTKESSNQPKSSANVPGDTNPLRFEQEVRRMEQRVPTPNDLGKIVFVGSSSIRLWKLDKSFPELPCINRGFGGSHLSDVNHYFDRLVTPWKPKLVVLYAGDNDISAKKKPATVHADFVTFMNQMTKKLPDCKVIYIGIKPSIKRWALKELAQGTNQLIQTEIKRYPNATYFNSWDCLLNPQGQPVDDHYVADKLHLSEKGYALWKQHLLPILNEQFKP